MKKSAEILSALRGLMRKLPNNRGSIQAYIVPTDDAHQSEYICDKDKRRVIFFSCFFFNFIQKFKKFIRRHFCVDLTDHRARVLSVRKKLFCGQTVVIICKRVNNWTPSTGP